MCPLCSSLTPFDSCGGPWSSHNKQNNTCNTLIAFSFPLSTLSRACSLIRIVIHFDCIHLQKNTQISTSSLSLSLSLSTSHTRKAKVRGASENFTFFLSSFTASLESIDRSCKGATNFAQIYQMAKEEKVGDRLLPDDSGGCFDASEDAFVCRFYLKQVKRK